MMTRLIISVAILTILSSKDIGGDPCRFESWHGVIDLSSLGRRDGQSAYPDRFPPTTFDFKYSYNPCYAFSERDGCQNVAACQTSVDGKYWYPLGTQDSASWDSEGINGNPSVSYTTGEKRVHVELQCTRDDTNRLEVLGEDPVNTYDFRLTHKCACWDGCAGGGTTPPGPPGTTTPPPGPGTSTISPGDRGGGISGGSIFIILLAAFLLVYFVGFAVFYRIRHERTGADLIAHRTFWIGLPGYAKDGVVYLYRRVSNRGADPYGSV